MSRNTHKHEYRNEISHLSSPIRHSVSEYVPIGLSESQLRSILLLDHPTLAVLPRKLTSLIQVERRKSHPKIFSIFDFRGWCRKHRDNATLHSTFVLFYFIIDVNDLFVLFTIK